MSAKSKLFAGLFAVTAAALGASTGLAPPTPLKAAGPPPACSGKDMLKEMRAGDPAEFAKIEAAAKATANAGALFWKIEGKGAKAPSYLLGTMHLTDKRITTLPAAVAKALASSKRLLLEVADMSPAAMSQAMAGAAGLLVFTDGRQLDTMLSKAEFATVKSVVTDSGMPAQVASRFKPWLIYMMMSVSACERKRIAGGIAPLDLKLFDLAKKRGIKILGLETAIEQLKALASIPIADQVKLLKASIKFYARSQDMMETMIGLYMRRQIGMAWPLQLSLAKKAGIGPAAFDSFKRKLINERNRNMHDRALTHFAAGRTFMAVGALHLTGKDGIVALLRQSGYKVTAAE